MVKHYDTYSIKFTLNLEGKEKFFKSERMQRDMFLDKDETEVADSFEFVPGRILVFPGIIPHRGLGPCVDGVYRSTVVWRVTPLDVYMKRVKRGTAK